MNNLVRTFEKRRNIKNKFKIARNKTEISSPKIDVPKGLYEKCPKCKETIHMKNIIENMFICKNCGEHLRVRSIDRLKLTVDLGTFVEKGHGYITLNPLFQDGYEEKISDYKKKTGLDEAYVYGYAEINGAPTVIGIMDSYFLMGSMGSVVGEKITKSFEYAMYKKLPIVIFTASGGARMQEGIFSLMQMAKTSQAVLKHSKSGLLYITVITNPTTGGVTASFASLGDIILAEPNALIGFAGPRVIEQTINQKLPEGFQRAEFMEEKGFIDKVVDRHELKGVISKLLYLHRRVQ